MSDSRKKRKVVDAANEFVRRAKGGEKPTVRVKKQFCEPFLGELFRQGVSFSAECLEQIPDPDLRTTLKTIFLSTTAFAVVGAAVGHAVDGIPAAKVGALVGAGVGMAASMFAVSIKVRQAPGENGEPELLITAA